MAEVILRSNDTTLRGGGIPISNDLKKMIDNKIDMVSLTDILSRITVSNGVLLLDGQPIEQYVPIETINTYGTIGKWFDEVLNGQNVLSSHYAGASIVATVKGTATLTANFRYTGAGFPEPPFLAVRINNGTWERIQMTDSVLVARKLNTEITNTIEIVFDGWNQTDNLWNSQRKFTLKSLIPDNSVPIPYQVVLNNGKKNLLIVGDSITSGTRTLLNNDLASGSSAVTSFARFLSDKMNANLYRSSFPGTKVTDPFTRQNVLEVTSGRRIPDYNIHTIIVEMGTNDYQKPSAEFISNYQLLINALRTVYPTQRIYLVGLFENQVDIRRNTELRTLASTNTNVTHLDTSSLSGVTFTDGLHPDQNGSIKIADYLYPLLVADGWINGGGQGTTPNNPDPEPVEPDPPVTTVPSGNLWTLGGKPTSYNPLPAGHGAVIPFPGSYAGTTFTVSFKAHSPKLGELDIYTEYKNDFNQTKKLTATATVYTMEFTVSYAGEGNFLYIAEKGSGDVVLSDIVVQKK